MEPEWLRAAWNQARAAVELGVDMTSMTGSWSYWSAVFCSGVTVTVRDDVHTAEGTCTGTLCRICDYRIIFCMLQSKSLIGQHSVGFSPPSIIRETLIDSWEEEPVKKADNPVVNTSQSSAATSVVTRRHSSNPCRIAVNPNLSIQNHVTYRISQGHSLYQVEHFGIIRFWFLLQTLVLTLTLTFQPKNIPLAGYPKVIPYIKFEHFGIICFWVMLWTVVWKMHLLTVWPWPLSPKTVPLSTWVMLRTNRQTNEQTDSKMLPTPTDIVAVRNYISKVSCKLTVVSLLINVYSSRCTTRHCSYTVLWASL